MPNDTLSFSNHIFKKTIISINKYYQTNFYYSHAWKIIRIAIGLFCYSAKSFAFKNKRTTKLLYWWKLSSSLSTYNLFLTCSAWRIFWEFWKWVCCSKTSSHWLPPAIIKWEINITRGTCLKTMRKQIWNKNGHCW